MLKSVYIDSQHITLYSRAGRPRNAVDIVIVDVDAANSLYERGEVESTRLPSRQLREKER